MSVQNVNVLVPPLRPVPPGAAWAANAIVWLLGDPQTGLRAWYGAARRRYLAQRDLRREAGDRLALTSLARRYESSQPEFAKDLFAAAAIDRRG